MRTALALLLLLASCDTEEPPARLGGGGSTSSPRPDGSRPLDAVWIEGDAARPLVVLMHGYGAPGDDLVPLGRVLAARANVRVALLAAPIELGPSSRAWWTIDLEERPADRGADRPAGLVEARRDVLAWMARARDEGELEPRRTVIGGFSQGAMLALDAALEAEPSLAGVVMLSGGPVDEARWRGRMSPSRVPRLFMSHGRRDPMLDYEAAMRLQGELVQEGIPVMLHSFDGGHTIPETTVVELVAWLDGAI
ncbi:MAG: alpha/beta hydrolase [Sandaracinaceae bacterium]